MSSTKELPKQFYEMYQIPLQGYIFWNISDIFLKYVGAFQIKFLEYICLVSAMFRKDLSMKVFKNIFVTFHHHSKLHRKKTFQKYFWNILENSFGELFQKHVCNVSSPFKTTFFLNVSKTSPKRRQKALHILCTMCSKNRE